MAVSLVWFAALPNYTNTPEDFALYAGHNGEWCLFLIDSPSILQCQTLKYLNLGGFELRADAREQDPGERQTAGLMRCYRKP
jgi:hypothetical protein